MREMYCSKSQYLRRKSLKAVSSELGSLVSSARAARFDSSLSRSQQLGAAEELLARLLLTSCFNGQTGLFKDLGGFYFVLNA